MVICHKQALIRGVCYVTLLKSYISYFGKFSPYMNSYVSGYYLFPTPSIIPHISCNRSVVTNIFSRNKIIRHVNLSKVSTFRLAIIHLTVYIITGSINGVVDFHQYNRWESWLGWFEVFVLVSLVFVFPFLASHV